MVNASTRMAGGFAPGAPAPAGRSRGRDGGWIESLWRRSEALAEAGDSQGRPAVGGPWAGGALHAVIDAVDEGLLLLDQQQQPVLANRRFREFFGLAEQADLAEIRTAIADCMADPAAYLQAVAEAGEDHEDSREFELVRPQRRIVRRRLAWVHDDQGQRIGRLVAYRDVTRDAEINQLKSDFVSNVSHELRTPMAAIKGFLGIVLDDEADMEAAQRRQFLTIAREQTERLSRLIEDLLDISRIEAGRHQLRETEVSLDRLLRDLRAAHAAQAAAAGLRLEVTPAPDTWAVRADRDKLLQILLNLVSNALKFTPSGGTITVTCEQDETGCRFVVTDTGCGIGVDDQPHIFEKFYRSRSGASTVQGTGLGLAIAAELAAGHGGTVAVESALGRGSTFTVWLPPERTAGLE